MPHEIFTVEKQSRDGTWLHIGQTLDPNEWLKLMQSAYISDGRPYRVKNSSGEIIQTTTLRDGEWI